MLGVGRTHYAFNEFEWILHLTDTPTLFEHGLLIRGGILLMDWWMISIVPSGDFGAYFIKM